MILIYLWGWEVSQKHGSCPDWGRREIVKELSCGFATYEYRGKEKILDTQHKSLNSQCCVRLHHKALVLEMHTEAGER